MVVSAVLILLSLPVIVLSLNNGFDAGGGIGMAMIFTGMAYPPLKSFLRKK